MHDLPQVVLSDHLKSFISWRIKVHDEGQYSHGMWHVEPGIFVSQGWILKIVPAEAYMLEDYRLKFWRPALNPGQRIILRKAIYAELNKPLLFKLYDPVGVIGQRLNIPALNIPFLDYCTEFVVSPLRYVGMNYDKHSTPGSLNRDFNADPRWSVAGYWLRD